MFAHGHLGQLPRPHQPHQVAGQERDPGAFDRDIGAAAHGDADVCG
jgi:hypothetical protein